MNLDKERCLLKFRELGFFNIEKYLGEFLQSGFFLDFEKGKINADAFRAEIRKLANQPTTDEQVDDAWNSFLVNIPVAKMDILLELRKKFQVLLLSNTNPIHMDYADEIFKSHKGFLMNNYFDKRYLSYQLHATKPDRAIFDKMISDARINPSECLFLDDGIKNIETANHIGFQTYLVSKNENLDFLLGEETWK